jgi:hypothetical protein
VKRGKRLFTLADFLTQRREDAGTQPDGGENPRLAPSSIAALRRVDCGGWKSEIRPAATAPEGKTLTQRRREPLRDAEFLTTDFMELTRILRVQTGRGIKSGREKAEGGNR